LVHIIVPSGAALSQWSQIREGDWKVAALPADLQDRRVEITGPTDRKMVINALNRQGTLVAQEACPCACSWRVVAAQRWEIRSVNWSGQTRAAWGMSR
jgi:hypothetical protein